MSAPEVYLPEENAKEKAIPRRLAIGLSAAALLIPPAVGGIYFWEQTPRDNQMHLLGHENTIKADHDLSTMFGVLAGVLADGAIAVGVLGVGNLRRVQRRLSEARAQASA